MSYDDRRVPFEIIKPRSAPACTAGRPVRRFAGRHPTRPLDRPPDPRVRPYVLPRPRLRVSRALLSFGRKAICEVAASINAFVDDGCCGCCCCSSRNGSRALLPAASVTDRFHQLHVADSTPAGRPAERPAANRIGPATGPVRTGPGRGT